MKKRTEEPNDLVATRYGPVERWQWETHVATMAHIRARTEPTPCRSCLAVADGWAKTLPRTSCKWPGSTQDAPLFANYYTAAQHLADWDVKNAEQIAHIFDVCRQSHTVEREVAA